MPKVVLPYGEANFNRLLRRYKYDAKRAGRDFLLTSDEFRKLTKSNCFYCGCQPSTIMNDNRNGSNGEYIYNGIDRIDSDMGYFSSNCIPCCKDCNWMKKNMSTSEFINRIRNIFNKTSRIETSNPLFIISEAGWNWDGDIEKAKELIYASVYGRADAVKFQLYDVDKIKKPSDDNYNGLKKNQLSKDDMHFLYEESKKAGIEIFFSVFDIERFNWLNEINVYRHKIAGRTILNNEIKTAMINSGKPVIASLQPSVINNKNIGSLFPPKSNVDYLYCLSRRDIIKNGVYGIPVNFGKGSLFSGFSDHTIGTEWAKRIVSLGASIIEKHITIDKNSPGWDVPASMTPEELLEIRIFADQHRGTYAYSR